MQQYKSIKIEQKTPNSRVFYLYLNRPSRLNAFPLEFFTELPHALSYLDQNPDVGAIVLTGAGDHFCAGIDLSVLQYLGDKGVTLPKSQANEWLRRQIKWMQETFTALERCRKPVIASMHGYCLGGALEIATACDIRYCTKDANFSVKMVDFGFASDMGTLQRLPAIVGHGNAMELALTARHFSGVEAKEMGLVSRVFESKEALDEGVRLIAEGVAAKSPIAVAGTKAVLLRSKDMTLEQGLDFVATWNAAQVYSSGDLLESFKARSEKRKPDYSKI